jgi:flavin reductase (DIM6/NTAB) family NADH-FMN oxidoreductase RutF
LYPCPTVLVGALVDGRPNYLVIGYICPFAFGRYLFFSIYKKRYTREGIHQNRTFSVNIPSENQLYKTNICGSKSGRKIDQSNLFDNFYGILKTAPMIRECPINIECQVNQILDYGDSEGVIGKVTKSYIDEDCLTDNELDIRKVRPILWSRGPGESLYYQLGGTLDHTRE